MANVICLYENKIATVAGTEKFFERVTTYNTNIHVRFISIIDLHVSDLRHCDVLYMIRPNNFVFANIARMARKKGVCVLFALDDNLLNINAGNATMPWRKRGLLASANFSHCIISPNQYICELFSKKTGIKRTVQMDTAVFAEEIKQHVDGKNERIKIVYAAGLAHKYMFDLYIRPCLDDLDSKYGECISLTFMGVHPEIDIQKYKMPIIYINSMPLKQYRERMENENFDIGLAPLISDEFTKCKYFNKFIEYSMFGVVGIYSNVEPYTFVINDGENGLLCQNTAEDWLFALSKIIEDMELVKKCRKGAYQTLEERFDSTTIMDKFIVEIPELLYEEKKRNYSSIELSFYKIGYAFSRMGDWLYKSWYYLNNGGMAVLYKAVRQHISVSKKVI